MKIPERLHRLAEVDADSWFFAPGRPERFQRAADRLMKLTLLFGVLYLAYLVVTALLFAAGNL